jgi:hypothetical protein
LVLHKRVLVVTVALVRALAQVAVLVLVPVQRK